MSTAKSWKLCYPIPLVNVCNVPSSNSEGPGNALMLIMRFFLTLTIFLLGSGPSFFCPVALNAAESGWKLVWQDEFNGDALDYSKWGVEVNALGGGNNELQFYTDRPENVRVDNGQLILEARKDKFSTLGITRDYSSARIRTKHRGEWKYARIEVKAKLPQGRGLLPAIWMLPTDQKYGGWAASGEIDIAEVLGHKTAVVHGTLHYGGKWPKNKQSGDHYQLATGNFADDFHLFALEWDEGEIRWYVDGEHYQTQKAWFSDKSPFPSPFDQRFHLILNLAVGGNWPGQPDKKTAFPARMLVEYVRVYQRIP